ncbi:glycosyltransferase [Thermodesulfobacteriota bacterium]
MELEERTRPEAPELTGGRICIVTPEYPPEQWGGLARTVLRVSLHAAAMGLDVHVAHLNVEPTPLVLLDENRTTRVNNGIKIHRISVATEELPSGRRNLWDCPHTLTLRMMYQSLEMLHLAEKFDLFHSFFLYPMGYVSGLLARRMGVPSIVTVVGNDVKKYIFSPEKAAVCRSGLENADRVVGLSKDLIDMADALSPVKAKARVIYNSVEIPPHRWIPRAGGTGPFKIGCAGIFKYAKGLPYLLKAIAVMRSESKVALELIGQIRDSEKDVLQSMLDKTGIRDILVIREPLPHDKMPDWLMSLDAYVLPSVSEGCPNILMEAMACGLPCVATRTGAMEDLVEDGKSGLLVPWGSSEALAEALSRIVDEEGLQQALGLAARTRMREFDSARERSAWEDLYQRCD